MAAALPFLSYVALPKKSFSSNLRGLLLALIKCIVLGIASIFFDDALLATGLNGISIVLILVAVWSAGRAWKHRNSKSQVKAFGVTRTLTIKIKPRGESTKAVRSMRKERKVSEEFSSKVSTSKGWSSKSSTPRHFL